MIKATGSKYRALATSVVRSAEGVTIRIDDNSNAELWVQVFISEDELKSYLAQQPPAEENTPEEKSAGKKHRRKKD